LDSLDKLVQKLDCCERYILRLQRCHVQRSPGTVSAGGFYEARFWKYGSGRRDSRQSTSAGSKWEELSASTEELAASSSNVYDSTVQLDGLSQRIKEHVEEQIKNISNTIESFDQVFSKVTSVQHEIDELENLSQHILA